MNKNTICLSISLLLVLALPFSLPAQIIEGPQNNRVYQRNAEGMGTIDVDVHGVESGINSVEVQLIDAQGEVIQSIDIEDVEAKLEIEIKDIPTGGPYRLEVFFNRDGRRFLSRSFENMFIGDLWILAGQSNMEGSAHLQDLEPPSPFVQVLRLNDEWTIAEDPLSNPGVAIDPVHWRTTPKQRDFAATIDIIAGAAGLTWQDFVARKEPISEKARAALEAEGIAFDKYLEALRPYRDEALESEMRRNRGAGLGVAFGKKLYEETGVPIGLIMNANGGTSMRQWDPALARYGGQSLYGSLMRRVAAQGGKVRGMAWYQGEDEAVSTEGIDEYPERMKSFVATLRRDLGDPELPIVYVQLARDFNSKVKNSNWFEIQNDQIRLEGEIENIWMVPALEESMSDAIHLDARGQRQLGVKMASVVLGKVYGWDIEGGPRPVSAILIDEQTVRVSFTGVNEALVLRSPRAGFEIFDEKMSEQTIAKVEVDPQNGKDILLRLLYPAPEKMSLRYAYGINPVCGLSDKIDLPVPAFGLMEVVLFSK